MQGKADTGGGNQSSLPKLVSFSDKPSCAVVKKTDNVAADDDEEEEEEDEQQEGKERTSLPKLVDDGNQKQTQMPPQSRSWIKDCHVRKTASMRKLVTIDGRSEPLSMQEYLQRKKSGIPHNNPPIRQWTYPRTTAEEVGRKARFRGNHLELFGKITRPKRNVYKTLKWPVGSE